ncbi:thioredoxin family protein, partial [Acinetobacter baumannii]|uniref:thioredoxin family protein n=1 Tax=Acinetobacter baumannii TaxID=470 RepID=UPI0037D266F7
MSTLLTEVGLYTYESYLKKFEEWVQTGTTSSVPPSQALVEFTKLNWSRTQRIHKTILLNPDLKKAVENIQHHYSWIVLTEAWCGDSAQNLPVIAEIAKLNPDKIKLFILLRDENPELMDKYLT